MFKKKMINAVAAGLCLVALSACGGKGDGMDYDQNHNVPPVADLVVSVVGTDFAGWEPKDSIKPGSGCLFTKIDSSHYQFKGTSVVGHEFKMVQDGGWSTQYGVEDMCWEESTAGFVKGVAADYKEGTSNRSNFNPLIGGDMTIDYYPYFYLSGKSNPFVITVK